MATTTTPTVATTPTTQAATATVKPPTQQTLQPLSTFTGTPQNQTPTAAPVDPLAFAPASTPVQTQTMQQVIDSASSGLKPILQQIDTLPYAYQDFFPGVDLS